MTKFLARIAVEQFDAARDHVGWLALDRLGIGAVDEGESPGLVAHPHRQRHGFKQHAQRLHVAAQFPVFSGQLGKLQRNATDFAQTQHSAAANHASFRRNLLAGHGRHRQRKAFAARAQRSRRRWPVRASLAHRARRRT